MNRQIQLTEQDLHFLVENAVKSYLMENDMEEGLSGLASGAARWAGNKLQKVGQNMTNTASGKLGQAKEYLGKKYGQAKQYAARQKENMKQGMQNMQKAARMGSLNQDAQKAIENARNALQALQDVNTKMVESGIGSTALDKNTAPMVQNLLNNFNRISGQFKTRLTQRVGG